MKQLFLFVVAAILFNACGQAKIEALNKQIDALQQDSIRLSVENQKFKQKEDSLKRIAFVTDSIKNSVDFCELGAKFIKIADGLKAYAYHKGDYQSLDKTYKETAQIVIDNKDKFNDDLRNRITSFYNAYPKGLNQIDASLSSELWFEIFHAQAKNIKEKLCNLK